MDTATGFSKNVAADRLNHLGGDVTKLKNELGEVAQIIYKEFVPALRAIVKVLSPVVSNMGKFAKWALTVGSYGRIIGDVFYATGKI